MSNVIVVPSGVIVNSTFRSRQDSARMACEAAGIVWPGTILPEGTALYTSGVERLKSDRAAWQRLPFACDVIGLVSNALKAEDRKDFTQEVRNIRFRPEDGRIVQASKLKDSPAHNLGLGYGSHALRQIVAQIDPLDDAPKGFASALVYLKDSERANILNERLTRMDQREQSVVLRTRLAHEGGRIARAALSERYGSVTDHDLAEAIADAVREWGDRSGRLDYKPGDARSRYEIIWASEIPVQTFVVGDVHYAGIAIDNSEIGQGKIRIYAFVVRAACANLTTSVGEGTEVTLRHVGSSFALIQRVKAAIRAAIGEVAPLVQMIQDSARVNVSEVWTPEKAFAAIARKFALPTTVAVPAFLESAKRGHYPTDTVWGIANSISDAAHGRENWTDSAEWERVASEFQHAAVSAHKGGAADAFARAVAA